MSSSAKPHGRARGANVFDVTPRSGSEGLLQIFGRALADGRHREPAHIARRLVPIGLLDEEMWVAVGEPADHCGGSVEQPGRVRSEPNTGPRHQAHAGKGAFALHRCGASSNDYFRQALRDGRGASQRVYATTRKPGDAEPGDAETVRELDDV
jgi:hypothetical protein